MLKNPTLSYVLEISVFYMSEDGYSIHLAGHGNAPQLIMFHDVFISSVQGARSRRPPDTVRRVSAGSRRKRRTVWCTSGRAIRRLTR